ncbi:NUDIX domain-containing protein [Streptomyces sp. NPDC003952]
MPDQPPPPNPPPPSESPSPPPSPYTDSVRAYYAAQPSPLVAATGIVLDPRGRVLVLTTSYKAEPELPGGGVEDTETPEEGLARELKEELDLSVPVGRLLAVDSRPPGPLGRSLVVHVHLVGPLTSEEASSLSFPDGEITEARWLTPEEAYAALETRRESRLRAALAALHSGSIAHLVNGVPQPGSPAGFDPAHRAELEHAGAYDTAGHRAARPKALTAASVLFTDSAGGVLLVRPAYGDPDHWNLPGGGIDSDLGEIPRAAARREVLEELGLDLAPGPLLAVNWSHRPGYPARVRFLYDGGTLDPAALARIRLPATELLAWRAVPPPDLRRYTKPSLRRQIEACLTARTTPGGPLELHAGRPVEATP